MWQAKVSKVLGNGLLEEQYVAVAVWPEDDGWHGFEYNEDMNRYFFNDIGEQDFSKAWFALQEMQGAISLD